MTANHPFRHSISVSTPTRALLAGLLVSLGACTSPAPSEGGSSGGGGTPPTSAAAGSGGQAGLAGSAGQAAKGGTAGEAAGGTAGTAGSAGLGGVFGDSGGQDGSGGAPEPTYLLGADISWLLEDEAAGAKYYDAGVERDLLELLRARGFNYIRMRTFVQPAAPGGYAAGQPEAWCDLAHTIELAARARALGMGLFLDLHYSDNWADPGKQVKPSAWAQAPFEQLEQELHDYTRKTVQAMVDAGVKPSLVQVGNEITAGMLFPDGSSADENWPRFARLLKAGASAVRAVDPAITVVLHIDRCGDNATTRWWVDAARAHEVPFTVLGQSCYTEHQGTPEEWQSNFDDLITRYPDLSFLVAEYSHEKRRVNDLMRSLPNGRGLGTFIWEPTRWMEAVFDRNGQRYDANALLDTYAEMASDYGL